MSDSCDPMHCSLPGSSVHMDSPNKNTRVGCRVLLQGIFLTQGSNPSLLHCRWILFQLSYQGSLNPQSPPFWPCGRRLASLTPWGAKYVSVPSGSGCILLYPLLCNLERGLLWASSTGLFSCGLLILANFSVLAWRIPGTGEPWGLPSMGLHSVGHD